MHLILSIGIGGFIGSVLRYLLSRAVHSMFIASFPLGTLTVNVIGCLLIGLVFELSERGGVAQPVRVFLATGIVGGFTTFSAFSNETVAMLRDGQFVDAGAYVLLSVTLGLMATFLGIAIIRLLS